MVEKHKVVVWGACSKLGHLLCERLYAQDYDVIAVFMDDREIGYSARFTGELANIHSLAYNDAENYLALNEVDISIVISCSEQVELSSLEGCLRQVWMAFELSYENFYRQRDGQLFIVSSYSKESLWSYRNSQGVESIWRQKNSNIGVSLRHMSFHQREFGDLDQVCVEIERGIKSSSDIYFLFKNYFFLIINKLKGYL